MPDFVHLHCHTQYSLLDGASEIGTMMDKAKADGQLGVALTDHGNMFGAFKFTSEAERRGLKPIIGCEFYLVEDRHKQAFSRAKGEKDNRYHQLLLAKNQKGYENLSKLCSLGFIEGLYGKYPRIDKELLEQYHEGLIATSCCIGAEIPQAIMHGDLEGAEQKLRWWLDLLGEDFYIEIQRHRGLENIDGLGISQEDINQKLLEFARKYDVKVIATNDSHYVEEEDWAPHDILLCVNTNSLLEEEKRFKFPSSDFYFKTQQEMNTLFGDVPESVDNTMEIFSKIDTLKLARDILLPAFPLPKEFKTQDDYLRHLTYVGAQKRYGTITPEIKERLDFELQVIENSGYPGYFLIVQDFTTKAREMGVSVGPGRGSAAGSAVAYCIGITNVDPIKYDLLFERFLNPERVSMPDIDIDFDDEGRQKVIDYVIEQYGQNQVAQIITYGTMAAKSSLRDVGRVMNIPLPEVDRVSKTFPAHLKATLGKVLADGDVDPKLKGALNSEELDKAYQFRQLAAGNDSIGNMIRTAQKLEGSIRNTGIHACGVVITPDEITKYVPVKAEKDTGMLVSQFDNSVAEDAGLLKMDFLGLKTLTIIKDAVKMVKANYGIDLDPDEVPLDDQPTYELFQRGETIGIFQYESSGMQKYMKELVPSSFEDLIAMNALYRPGPLEYIPNFIARKHGREPITYDLPEMEEYLADTYGITVYQEQVMLLSQKLAGFTKGQADKLRKAMGKKLKAVLDSLYPLFMDGGAERGHPKDVLDKVWKDWEAFASYAFNKSHSTCYAFVAFQTAYLKAHYPAEFMASVLTHNKNDITKLTFFLQECKRMGIPVLGPDVNESQSDFASNKAGEIRFGLSALKGVGEGPVEEILKDRAEHGHYESMFDMMRRLSLRAVNKKVVESLALGGAFDCFEGIHRAQYFAPSDKYDTLLEHALRYGNAYQNQKAQAVNSLFGDSDEVLIPEPDIPNCEPWPLIEKLNREKEVTGIFISGHPLDDYKIEIENFISCELSEVEKQMHRPSFNLAGMVTLARHMISKNGNGWGIFGISDYTSTLEFKLFGDDYQRFKHLLEMGKALFMVGGFQKGWRGDEMEFKVKDLSLLEGIAENMTESITIKLHLDTLTGETIDQLDTLCKRHRGKHRLRMEVIDIPRRLKLKLMAKERKVQADNDFIAELDKMGVEYSVN
ncbi:DNA polymerase III subunit alpha [Flavilitoribacter nigricans]|uniref:DNA polymerase III subunit alpha n=1 Tax=Flavilitoribacter nigricans (strain ATCC 23147 / DSM 23189 / NBRC 102662 / NCIMB 1420 / SS-2) TaxID=1122177 RepID=A0A2D0NL18_FLAN2|nr:DNA polymerase III subunit alpha [Flavilitoribacter nigricans]PHN08433.1 DNA polymerase III subunit alpha [Flavilitoribacter nigricans DSM 23189 = NBRC 102662]